MRGCISWDIQLDENLNPIANRMLALDFGRLDMQEILPKKTKKMYMYNWETTVLSYLPMLYRLIHDRLV